MKLSDKYPAANPRDWLSFMNPGQEGIALMFAYRLAAFFQSKGKKAYISSGYRDVARQAVLYAQNCKEHPPNGDGYVAKPGSSWHNGRCAIDLSDNGFWKKYMESGDMKKTVKQQELYKYGLCLPLNNVDAHTVFEWWHIQPIETLGYTGDRTKFLTDDKSYDPKYNHATAVLEDAIVYLYDHKQITAPEKIELMKKGMVDKATALSVIDRANKLKGGK